MPVRIQRKRTKGWKMPPNTIYVGRGSKWGNPFKIGMMYYLDEAGMSKLADGTKGSGQYIRDNADAVMFYEKKLKKQRLPDNHFQELKGKNLACWCPLDRPCHADVLLKIANPVNYYV